MNTADPTTSYLANFREKTSHLGTQQMGGLSLLLMHERQVGPLPVSQLELAQIAKTDLQNWRSAIEPAVMPFFRLGPDGLLHSIDSSMVPVRFLFSAERA